MMPSPMVWSTPPLQNGSAGNTTAFRISPATMRPSPRRPYFLTRPNAPLSGARASADSGRQKPTKNRNSVAASIVKYVRW